MCAGELGNNEAGFCFSRLGVSSSKSRLSCRLDGKLPT